MKQYAEKRQKMLENARAMKLHRNEKQNEISKIERTRERVKRERLLRAIKEKDERLNERKYMQEREMKRVEASHGRAEECAMWSPSRQRRESERYAKAVGGGSSALMVSNDSAAAVGRDEVNRKSPPKSPNDDVFYDANESLPKVSERVSIVEKASTSTASMKISRAGEDEEDDDLKTSLMRKKTKSLSLQTNNNNNNNNKISGTPTSNGSSKVVVRRPLSTSTVSNPPGKNFGIQLITTKEAKKSLDSPTPSAARFNNTMVNAKTGEIKSLRPPSFLASQNRKTTTTVKGSSSSSSAFNSSLLTAKKKNITKTLTTKQPRENITSDNNNNNSNDVNIMKEEEKSMRQMFDKRELRRIHAEQFKAAVQRWRMKNAKTSEIKNEDNNNNNNNNNNNSNKSNKMISVYARKRPMFEREIEKGEFDVVTVVGAKTSNEIVVHNCQMHADLKRMFVKHGMYTLHGKAFDEDVEEIEVYETAVKPLVDTVLEREGGCAALFMFGQTGSGKTHTMSNIELNTFRSLFNERVTRVSVQYFEIQGKKCFDLLGHDRNEVILKEIFETRKNNSHQNQNHQQANMEVELINATTIECFSAQDVEICVKEGVSRRTVSATQCNAQSSRSHAVLRLTVHMVEDENDAKNKVSAMNKGKERRLTLVDCAGSERKEDNVHHDAKQREETAAINASLYALKECARFRKLRADAKDPSSVHVPYRNSPLTKVLAECFVSDVAKMAVIGTVSPASIDTEHTAMTLKTIVQIGGDSCEIDSSLSSSSPSLYKESREDVEQTLSIEISKVTGEKTVIKKDIQRRIPPVKWKREELERWIKTTKSGAFAHARVPTTIAGRELVRMQPAALANMFNGNARLGDLLHKALRAEIQRCSVKTTNNNSVNANSNVT